VSSLLDSAARAARSLARPLLLVAGFALTAATAGAQTNAVGYDQDFTFRFSTSSLATGELYCLRSAGERPALADPSQEFLLNSALVGPTTDLDLTLSYSSVSGPVVANVTAQIDNATQQILVSGVPQSTLLGIFGPLPTPVGPTATLQCHAQTWIVILMRAIALIRLLQSDIYVTDRQQYVPSVDNGGHGGDPTLADEAAALAGLGLVLGNDPNAANTIVKIADPSDAYDCHGFTFTKGFRWINDFEVLNGEKDVQTVSKILKDNGYFAVAANQAQAGDIVVYRNNNDYGNNKITHTGKVVGVKGNGDIIVESKWGALGRYRHKIDRVPPSYGTGTVYRTNRQGNFGNQHFLGVGEPAEGPKAAPGLPPWGGLVLASAMAAAAAGALGWRLRYSR
jgi:signal peptidase I